MKRTLSLVLALVMVLGSFSAVFAVDAVDKVEAGDFLELVGVLTGDEKGNLMLDKTLLRRDMVVMLSRLMGVEETAKEFPAEELAFEDITDAFYNGYIAWAVNNEFIKGLSEDLFGFNNNVTAQQYATVLMRALGYEVDTDAAYKTVVADAKALGLLADVEVEDAAEITRGQMAVMTLNTLGTAMKDSETTLAESLKIEMPVPVVTDATKVEEVYADNLKEVVVVFDGEVDKDSAELDINYSLNKDQEIDRVELSEDLTQAVITLKTVMKNQKELELTVRNIKTAEGKLNTETVKFTPVDRAVPEVLNVEGLGDKAVKITFSEPVEKVKTSYFKIDGKSFTGSMDQNDNVVILKLYKKLSEGTHTIELKDVTDFAKYVMVTTDVEFEVTEDKEAPTIESVEATFEYVTVTFSEPVQDSTVRGGSYAYWKSTESSTAKNKADSTKPVRVSDRVYKYSFTNKALPGYSVYLYIEDVKDYSDNTIAKDTPLLVNAVIDQTRPEVVSAKINDANDKITIKFTKDLDEKTAKDKDNYKLLTDKDKKVTFGKPDVDGKEVTINLGKTLDKGDYTLKIEGVQDKTTLKNTMMPYSVEIVVGYANSPEVSETKVEIKGRNLYITYKNKMEQDGAYGVGNLENYTIKYGEVKVEGSTPTTINEKTISMPDDTDINPYDDGKTVIIRLPEKIDKKFVGNKLGNNIVLEVYVQGVKDVDGNMMVNTGTAIPKVAQELKVKKATLKEKKLIEIEFNKTVQDFNKNNVKLVKTTAPLDNLISYARISDGKLLIDLEENMYSIKDLKLTTGVDTFELFEDQKISLDGYDYLFVGNTANDKVAPELLEANEYEFTASGDSIEIKFTEDIATAAESLYAGQFKVQVVENGEDVSPTAYTVSVSDNIVTIKLKKTAFVEVTEAKFSVTLEEGSFVRDLYDNAAKDFKDIQTNIKLSKSDAL